MRSASPITHLRAASSMSRRIIPRTCGRQYILATLGELDYLSRKGFAFNMLTAYSDRDRQRTDLFLVCRDSSLTTARHISPRT